MRYRMKKFVFLSFLMIILTINVSAQISKTEKKQKRGRKNNDRQKLLHQSKITQPDL